ncbi:MAG: ABC transporter permease [Dehalococcoidia bacterium]
MRNTLAISWKEIRAYFTSPMAYIIAAVFVALTSYFFVADISSTPFPQAAISGYTIPITSILIFLAPVMTMRLLSEEQKLGTLELLLTAPIRDWEVVLGKFLASLAFLLSALALTLYYVVLIYFFGDPDSGIIFSGYLGLIFYGATALSVGLLTSSFTSNQIVAAVVGFSILLLLTVTDLAANVVSGPVATFLRQLSLTAHFDDFSRGVIDVGNVVYYVSVILVFLFLTIRSLETRRWR